jgi:hypothetical protein
MSIAAAENRNLAADSFGLSDEGQLRGRLFLGHRRRIKDTDISGCIPVW